MWGLANDRVRLRFFFVCGGGVATGAAAAMDKGKRAKVEEEEGSELDAELVMAIEKLQEVQDDLERVRANPRSLPFPSCETLLQLGTAHVERLWNVCCAAPVPAFLCLFG